MATYQSVTKEERIDVAPHLARAADSLRAAALLRDGGLAADAVTRAHQASVHTERALLATEKRSPQDARGVHRMATLHFLQAGELPREHLAALERLEALRARADDVPAGGVTADDAAESVELATAFLAAARAWLAARGYAVHAPGARP